MVSTAEPTLDRAREDPWEPVLDALVLGIGPGLRSHGLPSNSETVRAQIDFAGTVGWDASLPVHRAAKVVGLAPTALALSLEEKFSPVPIIEAAKASGAYLNFTVDPLWLTQNTLELVFARGDAYGHSAGPLPATCVEHTSANPTGPFHIGRVRNSIIGDTLARVLRAAGAAVTTQYYVDDLGRQAAMITWIWSKPRTDWPSEIRDAVPESDPQSSEKADRRLGRPYPPLSAFLKSHPESAAEVTQVIRALESGNAPPQHRELAEKILGGMLESLARIGIRFDEFVWESSFLNDGSVDRVIERLKHAPHAVTEPNGALALDTTSYGLPKETGTVVIVRSDGTSLYVTRDVAYHLAKFARFPSVVDVLGQDHQLHARTLNALLQELGESRRPTFVIYQDITLPEGGRMATHKGTGVLLDDLLNEATERARKEVLARREDLTEDEVAKIAGDVAAGAIRYNIARVAPEKAVSFRWEDALSFEGRSGPFVQYAYARASSILRKAEGTRPPFQFRAADLAHPDERALIRILSRFPRTTRYVARTNHVHTMANFAHEVADQFNRFYHSVQVLKGEEFRESRLALVAASRQTLGNALGLLGVERLDRM